MRVIAQELQELRSVIAAVLDPGGVLLEANAGFMHLLGTSPARRIGANVALLFAQPAFAEFGAVKASEGGLIFRGALKVLDASGQTLELPGQIWRTAFGVCVLAEYDIESLQASGRKHDEAAIVQREVRVVETSLTDKISGTGNRESLDSALATETNRVRRTGLPLTAFMTAIDNFAEITGEQGHNTGKKALARFGYLLRLLTRPTDIAARFEGDEFVVLLPHSGLEQGAVVARRIGTALGAEPGQVPMTASFGMAELQASEDPGAFLRRLQATFERSRGTGGIVGL